jgi:hypothetical protein
VSRVETGEADHRHPQAPGARADPAAELCRSQREAVVVVADRLGDEIVGPGQPPVEVRQVIRDDLVDRGQANGAQPGAVEQKPQRLRLAVADDQRDRAVSGRLVDAVEGTEMPGPPIG